VSAGDICFQDVLQSISTDMEVRLGRDHGDADRPLLAARSGNMNDQNGGAMLSIADLSVRLMRRTELCHEPRTLVVVMFTLWATKIA
jgi:allophanate hydrolase subunit 2